MTTWSHRADGALYWQRGGNNVLTTFQYDLLNQVTRLTHTSPTGVTLVDYALEYHQYGNCTNVTATRDGATFTNAYAYDLVSQLLNEQFNGGNPVINTYDDAGNAVLFKDIHKQ